MRTFKNGNWDTGDVCPVCGSRKKGEIILIPIVNTRDGNITEAVQVHTECFQNELFYDPIHKLIAVRASHNYHPELKTENNQNENKD